MKEHMRAREGREVGKRGKEYKTDPNTARYRTE
jgi:translation initiation factor IF-2